MITLLSNILPIAIIAEYIIYAIFYHFKMYEAAEIFEKTIIFITIVALFTVCILKIVIV